MAVRRRSILAVAALSAALAAIPVLADSDTSFSLDPLTSSPYLEIHEDYGFMADGLERLPGSNDCVAPAPFRPYPWRPCDSSLDRPMNRTVSGDFLSQDFVAELHVERADPPGALDIIFFGFGEGWPAYYNEPTDGFLFRIHSSGGGHDIDAVANEGWNFFVDGVHKVGQFDGDMTFRIERTSDTVVLSIPELGTSQSFDLSLLTGALDSGHIFFGNSLPGATFTSLTVTTSGGVHEIALDIKPGSDRNPVNLKGKGVIPVAILTTDDFDATTVDPATVRFGPGEAQEAHARGHIEDVDGDGHDDLVLHFKTKDSGIQAGDAEAGITGMTFGGEEIAGSDAIDTGVGRAAKVAASVDAVSWGEIKRSVR